MRGLLQRPPTQGDLERLYRELAELGAPSVGRATDWSYAPGSREELLGLAGEMLRYDPRLLSIVAGAVAEAAMKSGVATRPLEDLEAYKQQLNQSVYRTAFIMRRVFDAAKSSARRIVFAEGEDERVLHAARAMVEEGGNRPILIGRPDVITMRCERHAIPLEIGRDVGRAGLARGRWPCSGWGARRSPAT